MTLSELSVRRPVFAAVAAIILCVIGAAAFSTLPVRELPSVDPPVVSVQTLYRGASAEVVEERITEVIERQVAGIQGVDRGQVEAARSLGLSGGTTMRKVILPQAMRLIIPPSGNNFIGVLKATSLAAFVSGSDLLSSVQVIYSRTFEVIPLLIVATLWYLALVGVASIGQRYLERRFGTSRRERLLVTTGGEL